MGKLFHPYMIIYVLTILLLNFGFSYVPMIETSIGLLSPMAVVAGLVFVVRDFAHTMGKREFAEFLTFLLADPFVAVASVAASAVSELTDWGLYTATKKPFHQRVWLSSLISTPVDTAVFLWLIDGMTWGTFLLMFLAKMLAAAVIYFWYRAPAVKEEYWAS